jgi:hypothetical protein
MRVKLAKSYVVGKICPRKEPLMTFKVLKCSFEFLEMLVEMRPFREKGWKLPHFSR